MWHDIFQTYADAMSVAMLQSPGRAHRRHDDVAFVASEELRRPRVPLKQSQQIAPDGKSFSNT